MQTTINRIIPQKGSAKTIIQRLRAYIDPVDDTWSTKIRPANEMQIEELRQQLNLVERGLELPEVYVEFLHHAGECAGGLFSTFCAEMSIFSLISDNEGICINNADDTKPYCFTFLKDYLGICYTMNLDNQNQKIFMEEDYAVSENFENLVFQSAITQYEKKYYPFYVYFSSSIHGLNTSEIGIKEIDLFDYADQIVKKYCLNKLWFSDSYCFFACSNEMSLMLNRSGGGVYGAICFNEKEMQREMEKVLLSKINAKICKNYCS
ncbi:hypothetical protein IMSAGC007_01760 [Lachnospiraceae bacterium]|nr:hypothetical protein IMSAGC007_01760 [Lachnospiraceae bacterium]